MPSTSIAIVLLHCIFLCTIVSNATAQSLTSQRGYFVASVDAGGGYYHPAKNSRNRYPGALSYGVYIINHAGQYAGTFRAAAGYRTKRERLLWGVSFYRLWAPTTRDTLYHRITQDGFDPEDRVLWLDRFEMSDKITAFSAFIEPRLYHNHRWALSAHVSLGYELFQNDIIEHPGTGTGGETYLRTGTLRDPFFVDLDMAFGLRLNYKVNPYYSLFANARYWNSITSQYSVVTEMTAGIELNLRSGGVQR